MWIVLVFQFSIQNGPGPTHPLQIFLGCLEYFHLATSLNCTAKPKSPAVWACLGVDPYPDDIARL